MKVDIKYKAGDRLYALGSNSEIRIITIKNYNSVDFCRGKPKIYYNTTDSDFLGQHQMFETKEELLTAFLNKQKRDKKMLIYNLNNLEEKTLKKDKETQ